ncbi:MAG: hypothetical protein QXO70_00410 [Candidatus Pacearchaeota archaeon]
MKVTIFFVIVTLLILPLHSERIYFKNGDILTGDIWRETKTNTIIVTEHGSYKVSASSILKIDYTGKKKFRLIKKSGEISSVYPVESNLEEISFFYAPSETTPKKIKWTDVFALRIAK